MIDYEAEKKEVVDGLTAAVNSHRATHGSDMRIKICHQYHFEAMRQFNDLRVDVSEDLKCGEWQLLDWDGNNLEQVVKVAGFGLTAIKGAVPVASLNTSGLLPVEYKVLIKPEDVEKVSAGGIVMATTTTDRDKMAQVKGHLIAVGGNAFEDWKGMAPEVGDYVYYAKYAGLMVKGEDGQEFRLANDKDITAIIQRKEGAA